MAANALVYKQRSARRSLQSAPAEVYEAERAATEVTHAKRQFIQQAYRLYTLYPFGRGRERAKYVIDCTSSVTCTLHVYT